MVPPPYVRSFTAAAATFVRHDAQGKLIPATRSEEVPVETSFTLVDGSITTIVIGTDTYSVSYNSDGEVDHLTLVTEIVSTRCDGTRLQVGGRQSSLSHQGAVRQAPY